ncbi:PREDICTED: uncharacterized protein LOC105458923 [Wasmannia auropunctata]|uniref:uncharacterized protein LOC105458923 n=1 Tax=Wasmannia auropunctata TaxID=64793 RepID=UPI0005EFAD8F|nr:PREDICTED: uncharacterized protein LOC105458923 [Wasmannia auropunctata]XP_011702839.1 PREDICTED: uncharacterized protein LOC105458923 [Wasmannia auropunctata]
MVKMAYPPLSKLVPIDTMSNIYPNNTIKPTLSEVLQSDSVKRLFNQPNLIIKAIPLKLAESGNMFSHKRNGMNSISNCTKSEISILPVRTADEEKEDANLLPSKIEHKKSEIALLPIEKKSCGHYEPCENIVCDVTLQQYVDKDGVSPMLALSIEEDEINAPVEKHCGNKYCDALSIDHNRCRRALIELYRCDRSHVCDICGVTLKKRISRVYHRNCTRKKKYVHNDVDRLHLQKERMRIRELQILEISRTKKRDYSDPDSAMETLRRNEELIIIPQKASSQRPIVTVTSVPSTQLTSTNVINVQQPIKINAPTTNTTSIFKSVISSNAPYSESKVRLLGQVRYPSLQQNSHLGSTTVPISIRAPTPIQAQSPVLAPAPVPTLTLALTPTAAASAPVPVTTPTSVPTLTLTLAPTSAAVPALAPISAPSVVTTSASPTVPSHKQYIRLAVTPQTTTAQPITINNWIVSPSHILTTVAGQPKTLLAPIRVVPITNLISPPSLLHRTQGIPKFCIVAENLATPMTVSSSVQPTAATVNTATTQVNNTSNLAENNPIPKVRKPSKLNKKKKSFFCNYCKKSITTDWYFKMHIAKHKGEKLFFCHFCDESFSNNYDLKKHVINKHIGQKELACDKCNYTSTSLASYKNHIQTHARCGLNKADVHSKRKRKLDLLEDKISRKLNHNSYNRKVKIKCEDTSVSQIEHVEKHSNKELSTISIDGNAKAKGCNFASVKKIVEPENFEQESAITSR